MSHAQSTTRKPVAGAKSTSQVTPPIIDPPAMPPQPNAPKKPEGAEFCAKERLRAGATIRQAISAYTPRFKQEILKEVLAEAVKDAEDDEDEPQARLSLEKAHGQLKHLVRWLLDCTDAQKLAAMAADVLLNDDVQSNIRECKLYDGEIGDDLDRDWSDALSRMVEDGTGDSELNVIAAYIAGLDAAKP